MALYHKHRPQTFDAIVGQTHIVQTLQNQVISGKVAHAYLFSGPRGVGKTTAARVLAKAVNCEKRKDGTAALCNTCPACTEITGGHSIDVIEIDAASHTGVDSVRENIIENVRFKPTKLPYKVFIIDEVHMLSTSAFNALLKTLEEPPAHVIFVLATTEKHKVPETIISRCQRFDFKKIPYDVMKEHLLSVAKEENVKVDKEILDRIIRKSDGCARDALSLLDQLMATGEKHITKDIASVVLPVSNVDDVIAFVETLIEKKEAACLAHIDRLVEDGANLSQFAEDIIQILRIVLVTKAHPETTALTLDLGETAVKTVRSLHGHITNRELITLIDLAVRRRLEIRSAPLPQLPLELLVIEWCAGGSQPPERHDTGIDKTVPTTTPQPAPPKEEKKTLTQKVKELVHKEPSFSLEEVRTAWQDMIKQLESRSPSLVFILRMAELGTIDGATLSLNVNYAFHRDKLNEASCRGQIETMLGELLGGAIRLEVSVTEAAKQEEEQKELQDLAAAFGGEVIG